MNKRAECKKIPASTEKLFKRFKFLEPNNDAASLERTYAFIEMWGYILGWKFSYDWKSNPKHWFACVLFCTIWVQYIYSQIKYFSDGEYNRIFEVFAIYGASLSVAQKIWMFVKYHREIAALQKFSIKITRHSGTHMAEKLDAQQFDIMKLCKQISCLLFVIELIYLYHPITEYVHNGKLVTLIPVEMMFLDPTKLSNFLIFNALMALAGLWTPCVVMSIDFNFTAAISNCSIQVALIEDDIRRLDAYWRNPKATTLVERHKVLRDICQKCQDKDNYMNKIKMIFDGPLFFYFSVVYTSQIICLYEIKIKNWVPGYAVVLGNFLEMLIYCLAGTKASQINDQLCYVLTQSNWYTYDLHSQKIFLELLNSCMNAKELWIGPLAPLSVITGIQIVKSIYSYYTFLAGVV